LLGWNVEHGEWVLWKIACGTESMVLHHVYFLTGFSTIAWGESCILARSFDLPIVGDTSYRAQGEKQIIVFSSAHCVGLKC